MNKLAKPKKSNRKSKAEEWNSVRAELKKEFEDKGIVTCEIGIEGCTPNWALGFAHTKKRRFVTDLKRVVLACNNCHNETEFNKRYREGLTMEEYLERIIKCRE